ncbi:hypothetical protein [Acuticoccus kandeliae]|uniref:hypothetical protein n=1 Tax=Acuticoccus kandeliae TaxID=2073160 RepID=UPI000D3E4414|nr:hypothetical protein [Acuticoccus kandeliae]
MRLVRLASAVALILAPLPALAFDPTGNIVADALLNTLERSGYRDVTVGNVSRGDGATILESIRGVGTNSGAPMTIARARIVNGIVNADNELVADEIVYENTSVADENSPSPSTVGRVVISGARYPIAEGGEGLTSLFGTFDRVAVENVEARAESGDLVTIASMIATIEERDLSKGAGGSVAIEGLGFDVGLWEEPAASQMRALGYDAMSIDFTASGRWQADTGRAEISDVRVAIDDLGTLTLTSDLSGLTANTVASLQAGITDIGQLLPLLQSVTIADLSLAYTDAGLTPRVIDQLAANSNAPREAVTQALVATIPDALSILNAPSFTQSVVDAAKTFLDAPGTLSLKASPASPVSMAQLMGAVMMGPQMIPSLLNLEISARK